MEQAGLSIRYTQRPRRLPDELDLLMLEQEPWGSYIGVLTKLFSARYLQRALYGRNDEQEPVDCGWGETMALTVHAYPLAPEVHFRLAATCGQMGELQQETIVERQSISFDLATEQTITHPATAILDAQWLAGPYTTGGARVSSPALQVRGRSVISPIPLFGSVWLTLEVQRATCIITMERDEAEKLLIVHCRTGSLENKRADRNKPIYVHCRTGSLENKATSRNTLPPVHCRTGSLERPVPCLGYGLAVHCRTGSLETNPECLG